MNFFTTLIETCKGTKVFISLLSQSVARTLWHLFVLVFICSLFITACNYTKISEEITAAFALIEKTFGEIRIDENGITPQNVHAKTSLTIDDNLLRLTYLPQVDKKDLAEIDANDINTGVLWTPAMVASWFKLGPDKFLLAPLAYCSSKQLLPQIITRSSIPAYIKDNTSVKDKAVSQYSELSWAALNEYSRNTFISSAFFVSLISIIVQVLFFVSVFALILNLSSANPNITVPALKYRDRFIVGIYASFPPLLIASMFPAFDLPFLSFNSVYVICFSIYLIVVFTRLQLDFNTRAKNRLEL